MERAYKIQEWLNEWEWRTFKQDSKNIQEMHGITRDLRMWRVLREFLRSKEMITLEFQPESKNRSNVVAFK